MLLSKRNALVRIITFSLLLFIVPAILGAKIEYYTEEEYQDLSKDAVKRYWEDLEAELINLQAREATAEEQKVKNEKKLEDLQNGIAAVEAEYDALYAELLSKLGGEGVSQSEIAAFMNKLEEVKSKLSYYEQMPNSEIYKKCPEVRKFIANYEDMKKKDVAKVPECACELVNIDPRIQNLREIVSEEYQETHTVVKGEWLSKISGYKHIYNDPAKWGIIYRANRDKIRDPDLIYPDQVFAIPRCLPTTWKVYKGECLWTISEYPEVYDDPFKWPKIYRANTDKIDDPDLIYPNQILRIPRD
ncbi:MAG: LysM peptidoglycan-binding domain-containing protein [Candidatus Cloacimonetes bacterium]|nr:LysM peptidoglycan-binding domain-containing protein [Candidatus Cloacimonadota bacterium]MBS3767945.1 LysM peptidoglycan-binding domain-containing protein [Candidatus Cloacimonadota bacterium]